MSQKNTEEVASFENQSLLKSHGCLNSFFHLKKINKNLDIYKYFRYLEWGAIYLVLIESIKLTYTLEFDQSWQKEYKNIEQVYTKLSEFIPEEIWHIERLRKLISDLTDTFNDLLVDINYPIRLNSIIVLTSFSFIIVEEVFKDLSVEEVFKDLNKAKIDFNHNSDEHEKVFSSLFSAYIKNYQNQLSSDYFRDYFTVLSNKAMKQCNKYLQSIALLLVKKKHD